MLYFFADRLYTVAGTLTEIGDMMRLVGQVVESPEEFGDKGQNVKVVIYDPESRVGLEVVSWGDKEKGVQYAMGEYFAGLEVGETVDLLVGVEVYKGRLQVRPRARA